MRSSEASLRRYYFLKEKGFCVVCGQTEALPGKLRCSACQKKRDDYVASHKEEIRKYNQERWHGHRSSGLCGRCGKMLYKGEKVLCAKCRDDHRQCDARYKEKRKKDEYSKSGE